VSAASWTGYDKEVLLLIRTTRRAKRLRRRQPKEIGRVGALTGGFLEVFYAVRNKQLRIL